MKQSNLHLVIILAVLITAIVIAGILLIVFSAAGNQPAVTDEPVETVATTTATKKPSSSPTPSTSLQTPATNPSNTTATVPSATTSAAPSTTPVQTPVTPPATNPVTTPTVTPTPTPTPNPAPAGNIAAGDKVGAMQIFASYETIEEAAAGGKAKIRVTFYIESYSLSIGVRTDNYLTVNGVRSENLQSPIISLPKGSPQTRSVLYEYTCEVDPDSPPTIEYHWHFQGRYSGESAEWLSVTVIPSV